MKSKDLQKKLRAKAPKTWAKLDKRWEVKMIGPIMEFIIFLKRSDDETEARLWKLLAKARRLK